MLGPRQLTKTNVDYHIEKRLNVVSPTRLNIVMSIEACKSRVESIVNILLVGDVLTS